MAAFTSTSLKENVVYKQFLIRASQPVIFEIRGAFKGYYIKDFSNFASEEEVLLEPETTFKVVSIRNDTRNPKAKRIVVEVQQTPPMIKEAVENFARNETTFKRTGTVSYPHTYPILSSEHLDGRQPSAFISKRQHLYAQLNI